MSTERFPSTSVPSFRATTRTVAFHARQWRMSVLHRARRLRHSVLHRAGDAARHHVSWAAVVVVVVVLALLPLVVQGRREPPVHGSPARDVVIAWLDRVRVVDQRHKVPGYGRDCPGPCVFGAAWSDSTDAPGGRNGCTTREDVLARDIREASPVPGKPCSRRGGRLVDPYSGRTIEIRGSYRDVHVDHVYPLAAAWDMGAATWPQAMRERFANDVDHNLIAVSANANTAKGDSLPSEWMPPPAWRCFYAWRMAVAASVYDLPLAADDMDTLRTAARRCPAR